MVVAAQCAKAMISPPPPGSVGPRTERVISMVQSALYTGLLLLFISLFRRSRVVSVLRLFFFFSLPPFLLFVPSLFSKVPTLKQKGSPYVAY